MTTTTKPVIEQVYHQLVEEGRRLREDEVQAQVVGDRARARACDAAAIAVEHAGREVRGQLAHLLAGYR